MAAGSVTQPGNPDAQTGTGQQLHGHNRISTQALSSLAKASAARALGVPAHDIRVDWTDDDGLLALSIVSPVQVPPLAVVARDPGRLRSFGGPILDRLVKAKSDILGSVTALSGAQLSRVDIRISGVKINDGGRVR
ncbi:hypothetical protein V1638_12330 [Pseudarthrobacter sp. J64]|uniref:hypothetical protein n=1 Tax=Pseudarthrobacter sp. J64 TaxID=3116485 RepID=UPI002E823446|nr:hypothetical protein [Pseudarthrobacter sp. J64]MEE2570179.1 hypothetical protein [Pseudarthrobacter sp. J64]